jgi:hypothetical protein
MLVTFEKNNFINEASMTLNEFCLLPLQDTKQFKFSEFLESTEETEKKAESDLPSSMRSSRSFSQPSQEQADNLEEGFR